MIRSWRMTTQTNVIKTWHVPETFDGGSLKDFLIDVGEFSRQLMKRVRINGELFVNGTKRELWQPLFTGDELKVFFPYEERGFITPQNGLLSIVFEDADVIVIDKRPGLPVLPPLDSSETSIASHLLYEYDKRKYPYTVHIVTRLDRDTSGLMLIAKHAYSHMLLTKNLDQVKRRYRAVVHGSFSEEEGVIDEPIGREEGSIIRRTVSSKGKPSKTIFYLEQCGINYSLLRLRLLTGRTHQIRVHMSHIGYPLAGDTLYGGKEVEGMKGQALHCDLLHFKHPWTKEGMTFVSDPPEEWKIFA
jgi:23S rRNA pseudouridine1911/1915/1917 synthase